VFIYIRNVGQWVVVVLLLRLPGDHSNRFSQSVVADTLSGPLLRLGKAAAAAVRLRGIFVPGNRVMALSGSGAGWRLCDPLALLRSYLPTLCVLVASRAVSSVRP